MNCQHWRWWAEQFPKSFKIIIVIPQRHYHRRAVRRRHCRRSRRRYRRYCRRRSRNRHCHQNRNRHCRRRNPNRRCCCSNPNRSRCRSGFSSLPKFGKHKGAVFRLCRSSASMPERFFISAEVRQAVRRRPATIFGVRRVHIALTFRSCFLLSSSVKEGGAVRRGASSALPFFSASTDQRTVPWSILCVLPPHHCGVLRCGARDRLLRLIGVRALRDITSFHAADAHLAAEAIKTSTDTIISTLRGGHFGHAAGDSDVAATCY